MQYLTVREVATRLRVSDLTVRRWIGAGKLPATRLGRLWRVRASDLEDLHRPISPPAAPEEATYPPGTLGAFLAAAAVLFRDVDPETVREMERYIEEGCGRIEPAENLF